MFSKPPILICGIAAILAWNVNSTLSQEKTVTKLSARDLFLAGQAESTPPKTAAAQNATAGLNPTAGQNISSPSNKALKTTPGPLGLRYSILKQGTNGQYTETNPDTNFKSGDRIRLSVEANTSGYLYIIQRGSSGRWTLLFPSKEIQGETNQVEKGNRYEIPVGAASFQFDAVPGTEKLFLILSRQPEADVEKLKQSLRPDKAETISAKTTTATISGSGGSVQVVSSLDDAAVNKIRDLVATRDLIFEKVNEENIGAKSEKAVYVVNPVPSNESKVIVDINLVHR
jgi:hypothetical protein